MLFYIQIRHVMDIIVQWKLKLSKFHFSQSCYTLWSIQYAAGGLRADRIITDILKILNHGALWHCVSNSCIMGVEDVFLDKTLTWWVATDLFPDKVRLRTSRRTTPRLHLHITPSLPIGLTACTSRFFTNVAEVLYKILSIFQEYS